MNALTETTTPPGKGKQGPAVKLAADVHRAIGLRKLRQGGQIQELVDAALRSAFARELTELADGFSLEIVK